MTVFIRRKLKSKDRADAPSEIASNPEEFTTLNEELEKSGLVKFDPPQTQDLSKPCDDDVDGVDDIDLSPNWEVLVEDLPHFSVVTTKFSVFTVSDCNSCQLVVEILSIPNINKSLMAWLLKPTEKRTKIIVSDHDNQKIEEWNAVAVPAALAIGDLDKENGEPWVTTLQLSLKKIQIC
jgi:hypothetical protein